MSALEQPSGMLPKQPSLEFIVPQVIIRVSSLTCRSLIDPNLTYINPMNMPHPLLDVVITGSSGSLFCWRPEVCPLPLPPCIYWQAPASSVLPRLSVACTFVPRLAEEFSSCWAVGKEMERCQRRARECCRRTRTRKKQSKKANKGNQSWMDQPQVPCRKASLEADTSQRFRSHPRAKRKRRAKGNEIECQFELCQLQ
jgi:hypothetical protein